MRLNISGISLESIDRPPWHLKTWACYPFTVVGPADVTRLDLNRMNGELLHGKPIRGVESFAIENQVGKIISIAIDA
jgi:hypothetical protein